VGAVTEAEVTGRRAVGDELVGIREGALVAVRRAEPRHDPVALFDCGLAERHVAARDARHRLHGRTVAQHLLDGSPDSVFVACKLGEKFLIAETAHRVRDEIRRRDVAGDEQQHAHPERLLLWESTTIGQLGGRNRRDEVIAWLLAALLNQVEEVHRHLALALLLALGDLLVARGRDERLRPLLELRAVFHWNSQQFGDDDDRERVRDFLNEVHLAVVRRERVVQQVVHEVAQARLQLRTARGLKASSTTSRSSSWRGGS
jgi:hypothetical protein